MRLLGTLMLILVVLAGCASGTCSDTRLLQPASSFTNLFVVEKDSENDTLFLLGEGVSLWLKPCRAPDRSGIPGSLCGTVIVLPGVQFQFAGASARIVDLADKSERAQSLTHTNFDLGTVQTGSSFYPASSRLASRPYTLPGSRLEFTLFAQPYVGKPAELLLPPYEVNAVRASFPAIRVGPTVGRRCYHGAW